MSPWLSSDFTPRLSCESSLCTHWTMNSFWKLKPLIEDDDDDDDISPAGLIYPGIWVPRKTYRGIEIRLLPAADYHSGMFIKSYDSFRQFLSFFRLKVRLDCRSSTLAFSILPSFIGFLAIYHRSLSLASAILSCDTLSWIQELSELHRRVESTHGPWNLFQTVLQKYSCYFWKYIFYYEFIFNSPFTSG